VTGRVGRVGLQVWLVAAFVLVGAAASLAVLLVVLPTLESSVVAEAADREARRVESALAARSEIPGAGLSYRRDELDPHIAGIAGDVQGVARFTSLTGLQVRAAVQGAPAALLPTDGSLGLEGAEVLNAGRPGPVRPRIEDTGDTRTVFSAVPLAKNGVQIGVVEVAVPVTAQEGELEVVRQRVFLAVVTVLVLASLAGYGLSWLLGRRIARLAQTASQLSSGDLTARAPEVAPREVATLAGSLNRMADRLEDMLADVTSERDRARGMIGSLAEGVLAVGPDGEVTVANAAAERYLKPGGGPLHLADLPEPIAAAVREVLDDPERRPLTDTAALADGTELELQVSALAGRSGVVLALRDVTDERRLERARRDLVANVSHELKTPLSALKGFLELLEDEGMDAGRRREFMGLMSQETDRLGRLVEEQLELARLDAGALRMDMEDVDLAALAADVAGGRRPLAARDGVDLRVGVPGGRVVVRADPARIEQILLILLDNAVRHTPAGGRIQVTVRREDDEALLGVADTGEGIDPDAQAHVFDRFYQADPSREGRGTGLGLAIARGIVRAHGGSIDLESVPGAGSVFTVRLPLLRPATVPAG
jgi:two-component system sensor histidine kinase ResE